MSNFAWHRIPALNDNYIWLIEDKSTDVVVVIDPAESKPVIDFLISHNLKLTHILLTHHHYDHIGGVKGLREHYNIEVLGSKRCFTITISLDKLVEENDTFNIGNFSFEVYEADGHTLGHILYLESNLNWAFVGDTLFSMGCGRMFEGNPDQFTSSLNKIKRFSPKTLIFCAHEYTLSNTKFALHVDPSNKKT